MKYHLTYEVKCHPQGISKEEILEKKKGGCTAMLFGSLLYPDDGSYNAVFVSLDGRTGDKAARCLQKSRRKAWAMLGHSLSENEELSPAKRELCSVVHELIAGAINAAREAD